MIINYFMRENGRFILIDNTRLSLNSDVFNPLGLTQPNNPKTIHILFFIQEARRHISRFTSDES